MKRIIIVVISTTSIILSFGTISIADNIICSSQEGRFFINNLNKKLLVFGNLKKKMNSNMIVMFDTIKSEVSPKSAIGKQNLWEIA